MTQAIIGIDIGGTKIAGCLAEVGSWQGHTDIVPTPVETDAEGVMSAVLQLCDQLWQKAQTDGFEVLAIGVGSAGQIDPNSGVVMGANENLPEWEEMPIAQRIADQLPCPVYVDNDVKVLAIGESEIGAGVGYENSLFVAVGTGIGGAIVHQGDIYHGAHYSAGEIGYLVAGMDGAHPQTIEELASGPGMQRDYQQQAQLNEPITLQEIVERASDGDSLAASVIHDGAHLLGVILAGVLCFLDPEALIIGGGVPEIGKLWWQPFETALRSAPVETARTIELKRAQLGTSAGMIGAAIMAYRRIENNG